MTRPLAALVAGTVFGFGLSLSGMVDPDKVLAFLDIVGPWDPSLALVMGGALAVTGIGFRFVLRRPAPLLAPRFDLPGDRRVDLRLVGGAARFGVGWGLSGYCPGPAVAALVLNAREGLVFLAAVIAGGLLVGLLERGADSGGDG